MISMGWEQAIDVFEERAEADRSRALERWSTALPEAGSMEGWVDRFARSGRLTINFHPDRVGRSGRTAAEGIVLDAGYSNSWVTGVSAGSRSAIPGGERWRFEDQLFDGAYGGGGPDGVERPIYGAFDLLVDSHGGSPRFGSCYLVLARHVMARTTLCVGDSHVRVADVGTFARPWALLAGLADQAARHRMLNRELGGDALLALLDGTFNVGGTHRELDGYVEIHVHGGVSLKDDVEAIVLDPSFRGTESGRLLGLAADRFDLEFGWHGGSELSIDQVPDDFRGPTMPELARGIADSSGMVDARVIGEAAAAETFEEPSPEGDPPESTVQQLKCLWHTVLAHGQDAKQSENHGEDRGDRVR